MGTVHVKRAGGHPGHMFGVFKAPDGTVWVTSNQDFKQVTAGDPKKGVTQADLDATLRTISKTRNGPQHRVSQRGFD